jgi:hypothetical protein
LRLQPKPTFEKVELPIFDNKYNILVRDSGGSSVRFVRKQLGRTESSLWAMARENKPDSVARGRP